MKIYKLGLLAFITVFLFSCEKKTENLSRPTYYVAFEILGDNPAIVQVGQPYTDAGVKATINGQDVTSKVKISNDVNFEEMGMYKVVYSGINEDGLESSAVRDVIVCNPAVTTDISGVWNVSLDDTYRLSAGPTIVNYGGPGYTVRITRLAPGFYSVSDFLAGWYSIRTYPQYMPLSAMIGNFSMDEDNNISLIYSFIGLWEDGVDFLEDAFYDPENETVEWVTGYAGSMVFYVKLTK